MSRDAAGFTLLELLVALALFSLLSAMAYGGLQTLLAAGAQTDHEAERLARVQTAIILIQRDIEQTVLRPVRDGYGSEQPALLGGGLFDRRLELTRAGRTNPLHQKRSHLQRVAYRVEDQRLIRSTWPTLDRTPAGKADETPLLARVSGLEVRFLDRDREWHADWPALTADGAPGTTLPIAVEVTLILDDWGRITRLFPVGSG